MNFAPKSHWTPRYVVDRVLHWHFAKQNPDWPWLNRHACRFLEQYLSETDRILEFGSGSSTTFFAQRCESVRSLEHDNTWLDEVRTSLASDDLDNVELTYQDASTSATYLSGLENSGGYSVALVDAVHRAEAAFLSLDALREGGLLVIDNVNRYLPSATRSPVRLSEPISQSWDRFKHETAAWPQWWTSDGVVDTLFLWKPCK